MTKKQVNAGKDTTQADFLQVPLYGLLESSAKRYPEKTAIIFGKKSVSYAELNAYSNRFANVLCNLGIGKGDRVALFLPNSPKFVITLFGILKAGAVVSAINPLHREREVEYQLRDSGAKMVVTVDSLERVVKKVKENVQLMHVIVTAVNDNDVFEQNKETPIGRLNVKIYPDDLAALQYTGGTTGTPRAAMLTHSNLAANAQQFARAIKGTCNDRFLTALPLFHIYGLTTSLTAPISLGATTVLLPKFEPATALEAVQRHKVSVFCGVPTMYQQILASQNFANYDLRSIRVCISGASSLPPQVQKRFMEITGGLLAEGYGLTEASPVTHCSPVERSQIRVGTVGVPVPDTDVRIVDAETGMRTIPIGETGELAVRGPQIMAGYWNRPDETAAVLHSGWLLTGDIARIDADGYLTIVDRKKDLIKHNGYSVSPRELEDLLYEHAAVKQCAVVGEPDANMGENPTAYVVLKCGAKATDGEIKDFVNVKVAPYKAIRKVVFMEALPLSAAGKLLKRNLTGHA